MIASVISQSVFDVDLTNLVNPFIALTDFSPTTTYWFHPYKSSDFPELTCDKDYFFLYSTDHDAGDGGIWWGKGNNLDLSDFEEVALLFDGYQAETPFLYRFPDNTRKIHLYYHTDSTDPSNGGIQRTKLRTTTGGLLHTATWVQESDPLGSESGDNHLGYFKFWDNGIQLKGVHYKTGISYQGTDGSQQYSTLTSNGLTGTRGNLVDIYAPDIVQGRIIQPSFGTFFKKYNQWWWIGCTRRDWANNSLPDAGSLTNIYVNLVLCKANEDLILTDFVDVLVEGGRTWECFIEDDTAHFYESVRGAYIRYGKFDLKNLVYKF